MHIHQIPQLRKPVAIMAFNGWNDAGEAATGAISHLMGAYGNQENLIAESESEEFYDYQQIRPMVFIDNSKIRQLKWPTTKVFALYTPHLDFDIVLVKGPEPSFKWQTFTRNLIELFDEFLGINYQEKPPSEMISNLRINSYDESELIIKL